MLETPTTDSTARPSPNENHLLINAYTTHPESPLLSVTRRIADSGCNLVDARLSTVGRDVSVTALATGSWDSVAKLEAMLTRLEREEGLKLVWYRTGPKPVQLVMGWLGRASEPQLLDILDSLVPLIGTPDEDDAIDYIYRAFLPVNFSRDMLERSPHLVCAMPVEGVEWSDWGRPERIEQVLAVRRSRALTPARPARAVAP